MIRWLTLFWLLWAAPVAAAPVVVTSGEHDGFTRLVLNFGQPVDWHFGRTADGYQLGLAEGARAYDLRQAFDLIGKSRLAAIWVDPESGALQLGLACACHAMPFEFRLGIVVIDLKDGPPPAGSSFELAVNGAEVAALPTRALPHPKRRPGEPALTYDWTKVARSAPPAAAMPLAPAMASQQPLRSALLQEMAQAATRGVLDMEIPQPVRQRPAPTDLPQAHIRMGDQADATTEPPDGVRKDLTAQGAGCVADASLTMIDWADPDRPMTEQLGAAMANLTGEFDRPDPIAVARAVRFYLYFGFGAEAEQVLKAFPVNHPDLAVWHSLSLLVDGGKDAFFAGQEACGGPAAMWAVLADPPPTNGDPIDRKAVRLAFSALPLHLRRWLGPTLAQRFLAIDDAATANAIRDAILRAPGDAGAGVAIMAADIALQQGDAPLAEAELASVLSDPGPDQSKALISFTEVRVSQGLPVRPDVATALQSLLDESDDSPDAPRLRVAIVLALAASGDFDGAFAALSLAPEATADLWALVARLAPDAALIAHGVLAADAPLPSVAPDVAQALATRLLDLGLPDPAARWISLDTTPDPILAAKIALARADGRLALTHLASAKPDDALPLQAAALERVGMESDRATLLRGTDPDRANVALARAGDWGALAKTESGPWRSLAALAMSPTAPVGENLTANAVDGPLTKGHLLATDSAQTRATVHDLLAGLASPAP